MLLLERLKEKDMPVIKQWVRVCRQIKLCLAQKWSKQSCPKFWGKLVQCVPMIDIKWKLYTNCISQQSSMSIEQHMRLCSRNHQMGMGLLQFCLYKSQFWRGKWWWGGGDILILRRRMVVGEGKGSKLKNWLHQVLWMIYVIMLYIGAITRLMFYFQHAVYIF